MALITGSELLVVICGFAVVGYCEGKEDATCLETMEINLNVVTRRPTSCSEVNLESTILRNETGGVFEISLPDNQLKTVYCDMTTDGGGWTVFQRRTNGDVDFSKYWNDYAKGFGNPQGEFWLGLEALHQLTNGKHNELRIDMITFDGTRYYAKYSTFGIGPSSDNYRLTVSGYSGNATDSLHYHNNRHFTTKDADHDEYIKYNCAVLYEGGWWFRRCLHSNLNGVFEGTGRHGIVWRDATNMAVNLRFSEMKFRPSD